MIGIFKLTAWKIRLLMIRRYFALINNNYFLMWISKKVIFIIENGRFFSTHSFNEHLITNRVIFYSFQKYLFLARWKNSTYSVVMNFFSKSWHIMLCEILKYAKLKWSMYLLYYKFIKKKVINIYKG